ncbi:hypothetical protein Hanom_Chr17g01544691 [Helianthus anomalus]
MVTYLASLFDPSILQRFRKHSLCKPKRVQRIRNQSSYEDYSCINSNEYKVLETKVPLRIVVHLSPNRPDRRICKSSLYIRTPKLSDPIGKKKKNHASANSRWILKRMCI